MSLRARIVVTLVASIVSVVCIATVAALFLARDNGPRNYGRHLAEVVNFVAAVADVRTVPAAALVPAPPQATLPALTARVQAQLEELGSRRRVVLARGDEGLKAYVELGASQWLAVPLGDEPRPPDPWPLLSGWMFLILLGSTALSWLVASRVTRPLRLMEAFASRVGPHGELETVPETGPAEVRATARALNELSGKLRKAMESRMRLVAAAGHDLRTPLTRMRLRAEFLDEPDRSKWIANIAELERIAESAILLVREETGGFERTPVDLGEAVERVCSELRAIGMHAELQRRDEATVTAPAESLTRALRNLILNAATHGGGAVVRTEIAAERALVVIEDDGPGIPEELIDRVFEPFFRADPARRQNLPGAGLGLAIAKEIIDRIGGELLIGNRPGGGLLQTVSLKLEYSGGLSRRPG